MKTRIVAIISVHNFLMKYFLAHAEEDNNGIRRNAVMRTEDLQTAESTLVLGVYLLRGR